MDQLFDRIIQLWFGSLRSRNLWGTFVWTDVWLAEGDKQTKMDKSLKEQFSTFSDQSVGTLQNIPQEFLACADMTNTR